MLLCVAGGGSSGFSRDRSREGSHCSAQSVFTKNNAKQQVMVDERCSMTSTAVNVPQDLTTTQESLCLDLRKSRSFHNKPSESSLAVRGKVIVVRGDDIVCESTENEETCATTTTFKSNIVNGKRSTNTILVRYKSSKSLSQSSDICQNESGGRNEGFQEYRTSVSSPSSTASSENSTSSQNDKISTSAWAQIMELEGYRSPAIGLDKLPDKDNDNISDTESIDVFTPVHSESLKCYSGDSVCNNGGEVVFTDSNCSYINSSARKTIESNNLKSSVSLNKDLDRSVVQYNSSFPVVSHAPEASFTAFSEVNHLKNKSNWHILKAEDCDKADSSYGNSSSDCNDKISEDSLTLHCSLPNESCIRIAQKVKSPMYRSESSRVTKATPLEKNKSRRKTLPDGNLHFSNGNSQEIKCANKKQISIDADPNASWGRYNAKAMRESVRKVAQKYSETAYLKRQTHSKFDAITDVKGVQLTKFVSPYTCQDHLHSSTTSQYHQNNLFCSRVPSIPSHLHHVAPETDSILSTRHNLHLIAPTSTHHDHDISIKDYLMNFSCRKRDSVEHVMKLDHNPYVHSDKTFAENESTRSSNSQVNNGSKHSSLFNCDSSRSTNAYNFNYPMCENCSKSKMCTDSYQSPKCVNFIQNEDLSLRSSDTVDKLYSSVYIHDIKAKLCSNCAQAAEYGPPSKHSASRTKCHKTRNSLLNSSNLSSPLSLSKESSSGINNTYSNLSDHSLYVSKDDYKNNSVKCGTLLTAREMSDLVHGNNPEKLADSRIPLSGVTSKVTNWIQKQRDKRKPVFFIGDAPTYISSNYEEGDTPNRALTRKSKRSLSLSSVREDEISSNCKSFAESSLNLSVVRLNPSACDDRDYEHKHLYIKRASSCCSNRGSIRRKIRQGSPVREEKESFAKNLNDPRNQVDGCIASGSKCQNYRVKNKLSLDNDPDKKEDVNFKQESLSTLNSQYALPIHEYSLNEINQSKNKFTSDINVKTECSEQKDRENEELISNNSACKNAESLNEVKSERSSFSKRLLHIKQLTRALSLHSLKKKNKESACESPSNKARAEEPAISAHFSKWYRNSKRKLNDSKYGSLRKSMSYCELTVREATTSSKSISQINAYTEIKRDPKSSARTSVPFMNYVCCSATIRRSVSLYWKFPLSRCLEYSVEDTKSDFLARLCFSRLYSRNRVPPFVRQLKNRHSVSKMKDSDNLRTNDERNLHLMDTPLHDQCDRIPVIILPNFTGSDANILRKRAASTSDYSPKSKAIQRPMSVADYLTLDNTPCTKVPDGQNDLTTDPDTTSSEEQQKNLTSLDQIWRANPVKLCRVHSRLLMCRHKGRYRLRRSISQPVELEMTGSVHNLRDSTHGSSDHEHFQKGSLSSDDEASSESDIYHSYCCSPTRRSNTCWELSGDGTMYAEALWDHETIDPEELPFLAGDIIEVTDTSDQDWWWGTKDGHGGWFPSAFVRLYVSHRTPSLHYNGQQSDRIQIPYSPCKVSMNNLSCEQVRANIVQEIVATERDYVKHLKDVVEGYLKQVHRRPDMFSKERIETVFGNIKEIYTFQSQFLKQLEECLDKDAPNLSQIGNCFLNHKEEFKMYSQYCNNHPLAVSELQELYCDSQYIHFFEACRLLQEMIDISLDGFLLTPIQRICKYPLQLAELLKFTDENHPDHVPVTNALAAMKDVAELVNERKRRMECLERIAEWQSTIEGWEGPDVLDTSSILIHCGEVTRVSSSWSRDIYLFIFDHQLIYCKKDLLKRHTYAYKGRLNLDHCDIVDIEDGKDSQFAVNIKNAWKIYCKDKDKWYLFYAKTSPEKDQWLCAFKAERQRVIDDEKQAFVVTEEAKKSARLAVHNKQKPKRPRAKFTKGRRCHPDVAVTELLLDSPSAKARSGSLPSNIHPELAIMTGAKLGPTRKKGSGWFHFGSGKKPKS